MDLHIDIQNECLTDGSRRIALTPKAYSLLRELMKAPGTLVTKEHLLDAVWPHTIVGDAVLKVCVRELRQALGDDAKAPRFIETQHRRGYRFVGTLRDVREIHGARGGESLGDLRPAAIKSAPRPSTIPTDVDLPGRGSAIARLTADLLAASRGQRQVCLVSGAAGIGKTAVVDAFLSTVEGRPEVRVLRGDCIEHHGPREPYLPVLDALSRVVRQGIDTHALAVLRRLAPTWLRHVSGGIAEPELPGAAGSGAVRERMLREMAEALDVLAADAPLILVIEDLHWADVSTLDLLSVVAARRDRAQLLVIGTFRPVDAILADGAIRVVRDNLVAQGRCREFTLDGLLPEGVRDVVAHRFRGLSLPTEFAPTLYEWTNGHPLFLVNVIDWLLATGVISTTRDAVVIAQPLDQGVIGIPESVQQMIQKQVERLSPQEIAALEVGSVAGMDFSSATVAIGLEGDVLAVEECLERMVRRRQFLRSIGVMEWPDGTVSARYEFIHSLYRNALYRQVAPSRRRRLHQVIGTRGEAIYGDRVAEIAAKLAVHFEQSGDFSRAVRYLRITASNELRLQSPRSAVSTLRHASELIDRLQEGERGRAASGLERDLRQALRAASEATRRATPARHLAVARPQR